MSFTLLHNAWNKQGKILSIFDCKLHKCFVVYVWAIMLPVMINSPPQCSVEWTCWTYIKFILWYHFVNSNIYVHFNFSRTHWCKPHRPLRCLLLIHKLSLMNSLEIPLPQYINQISQTSNLTPFKIVSHDFPQPVVPNLWGSEKVI